MGADFCMAKFPKFDFNDDRKEQFRQAITNLTAGDEEYLRDCYYSDGQSLDEIVEDMFETIEEASSLDSRETSEWQEYDKDGNTVYVTYTGGMSWGDAPTEAYFVIDKASHLDSVYDLAMIFSAEDRVGVTQ